MSVGVKAYDLLIGSGLTDIVMPRSKFIKEHKNLLKVLKSGDPKLLKKEYAEQKGELMKELKGKGIVPIDQYFGMVNIMGQDRYEGSNIAVRQLKASEPYRRMKSLEQYFPLFAWYKDPNTIKKYEEAKKELNNPYRKINTAIKSLTDFFYKSPLASIVGVPSVIQKLYEPLTANVNEGTDKLKAQISQFEKARDYYLGNESKVRSAYEKAKEDLEKWKKQRYDQYVKEQQLKGSGKEDELKEDIEKTIYRISSLMSFLFDNKSRIKDFIDVIRDDYEYLIGLRSALEQYKKTKVNKSELNDFITRFKTQIYMLEKDAGLQPRILEYSTNPMFATNATNRTRARTSSDPKTGGAVNQQEMEKVGELMDKLINQSQYNIIPRFVKLMSFVNTLIQTKVSKKNKTKIKKIYDRINNKVDNNLYQNNEEFVNDLRDLYNELERDFHLSFDPEETESEYSPQSSAYSSTFSTPQRRTNVSFSGEGKHSTLAKALAKKRIEGKRYERAMDLLEEREANPPTKKQKTEGESTDDLKKFIEETKKRLAKAITEIETQHFYGKGISQDELNVLFTIFNKARDYINKIYRSNKVGFTMSENQQLKSILSDLISQAKLGLDRVDERYVNGEEVSVSYIEFYINELSRLRDKGTLAKKDDLISTIDNLEILFDEDYQRTLSEEQTSRTTTTSSTDIDESAYNLGRTERSYGYPTNISRDPSVSTRTTDPSIVSGEGKKMKGGKSFRLSTSIRRFIDEWEGDAESLRDWIDSLPNNLVREAHFDYLNGLHNNLVEGRMDGGDVGDELVGFAEDLELQGLGKKKGGSIITLKQRIMTFLETWSGSESSLEEWIQSLEYITEEQYNALMGILRTYVEDQNLRPNDIVEMLVEYAESL